ERLTLGRGGGQSSELGVHDELHKGEKPHKCSKCEKRFSKRCFLNRHWRIHTGEWPYECGECGKKFSQRSTLTIHQRSH
ncbi:ZN285 protein, partial [Sylvia atricapilla]|nr:ZN285 protein [Sylvia atricapilla]